MMDRLVYITGGSSGIGLASAEAFLREGCRVVLFARNGEKLNMAADRLNEHYPGSVSAFVMDVTDRGSVERAVRSAAESSGAPELLLTCAGNACPDYFENISDEAFHSMLDTNLTGTWNTLQAVVPLMQRGASIVTVSSVAGFVGTFGYTAYGATKFAVIGLSQALRGELKPRGIRVSVLCPPDTDTPQLIQEDLSKPPETRAVSGNVKIMKPEAVARALLAGLKKNRFLIIPGSASKLVYAVNALFPGLVRYMMDSDVRRVQKKITVQKDMTR